MCALYVHDDALYSICQEPAAAASLLLLCVKPWEGSLGAAEWDILELVVVDNTQAEVRTVLGVGPEGKGGWGLAGTSALVELLLLLVVVRGGGGCASLQAHWVSHRSGTGPACTQHNASIL